MFRKLVLIAGAVVALGAGVASAPAPAAAQYGYGFHGYGYGYGPPPPPRYYDRGYYGPRRHYRPRRERCERVVVRKRVYGEWRRIVERRCYPARYY